MHFILQSIYSLVTGLVILGPPRVLRTRFDIIQSSNMAPETAPKPIKAGLSLYANLLDPSSTASAASGTISRAPVVFKQPPGVDSQDEASAQKQQLSAGRYLSAPV